MGDRAELSGMMNAQIEGMYHHAGPSKLDFIVCGLYCKRVKDNQLKIMQSLSVYNL